MRGLIYVPSLSSSGNSYHLLSTFQEPGPYMISLHCANDSIKYVSLFPFYKRRYPIYHYHINSPGENLCFKKSTPIPYKIQPQCHFGWLLGSSEPTTPLCWPYVLLILLKHALSSLVPSFIQSHIFIEHLLCAGYWIRCWGHGGWWR